MSQILLIITLNLLNTDAPIKGIISLLDSNELTFSYDMNHLPRIILNEMESISDYEIEIANPDENFNKSDAIENDELPIRRLIFLAHTNKSDEWLMYYEIGGRAHNSRLIYCRLANNERIRKLYCIAPDFNRRFTKSKELLQEMLKSDEFTILYNNGNRTKRSWIPF